jgi:hypothetical protein
VTNPYTDGYLVLRCFHEVFGRSAVHSVLDRTYPNFWATLEGAFECDLPSVYARWLDWSRQNTTP